MEDKTALTFVSLGQVVATYVGRPAIDHQAEINRMAQYYGAQILEEPTGAWDKTAASVWPNIFGPPKQIITEDAEAVSIETVE